MATNTPISTSSTASYDEVLELPTTTLSPDAVDQSIQIHYDLTSYLLIIFPIYICAVLFNFLSIYSILIARIYRQYLSNVLLAVICIGALINVHGHMFLILLRWGNNSASNQLCSSSFYLRDSGSILIQTHILLLAVERILANLKKHPTHSKNNLIQKAHLFLIVMSLCNIVLALTVPIYTYTHSSFQIFNGLCIPMDITTYKQYFHWIYYGFGYPFVWTASILLGIFFSRKITISYSTLVPMNRIILIISLFGCFNLLLRTLLDDIIGIGNERPLITTGVVSQKISYLMNLRDFISILDKFLIGFAFFFFRPEIRLWFYESMKKFQSMKKEIISPQRLDIRNDLDDNYRETDDGDLQFRSDI